MLIRHVDLKGALVDVRVSESIVSEVGLNLEHDDEVIFEGEGGALLPGLHDHHIHLNASAAAMASV